ncbi:fibulin-1-like [Pungitius pungitius]|uniref:fibulin-1-like n=1 Tax=Pungitius pungitius TaxID=134920 RepID=UPI002E1389CF
MARWMMLLFVCSAVNAQALNYESLMDCCKAGRVLALSRPNCTLDHRVSSSDVCGFVKEKCCSGALTYQICKNGIETAEKGGNCNALSLGPAQGSLSKLCCDCCKFGLSQAPRCGFRGLFVEDMCLDTAIGCCVKNSTVTERTPNDVDECLSGVHTCKSDQVCINTVGSFICQKDCAIGFELNDNICQDIDECAWLNRGHQCSYNCSNVPGSFRCTCPSTGYTLAQNGRTCQDIDECAAGTHTCSLPGSCFNILGGFRCLSLACPQYFQLAGQGKDTSASWSCQKTCHPYDVRCNSYPIDLIRYISLSLETVLEISNPKEIVFLQSTAAANYAHLPGATDVAFNILVADDQSSFDVIKRPYEGMFVGVVRQVKPLRGPRDLVLQVAMNYVKLGVVSYRNIVIIHIFLSEFLF